MGQPRVNRWERKFGVHLCLFGAIWSLDGADRNEARTWKRPGGKFRSVGLGGGRGAASQPANRYTCNDARR